MRTLILGGTGLLGPYLKDAFKTLGEVVAVGSDAVDVRDPVALAAYLGEASPDVVVNCVACTDVDLCERDPALADGLNRAPVETIVGAISPETRLVQISTDQVYPGAGAPHREDGIGPINEYGRSKLAGEAAANAHAASLILRVNLFGPSRTVGRKSLSDWLTEALGAENSVTLFTDSYFSPLRMATLAGIARDMVAKGISGTYNLGCREGHSKAWFARRLAESLDLSLDTATEGVSTDLPGRAPRPRDMRMDVSGIEGALGITLPTLEEEIRDHAAEARKAKQ